MAKLYFCYAAMNAGKSTLLLQASHNYAEQGMSTLIYTSAHYATSDDSRIVSRLGISKDAKLFHPSDDLFANISRAHKRTPVSCIFFDEAQFLTPDQVWQLARVADRLNIPVLCFGLRTDFQGKLFEGSAQLLAIADSLREIRTICHCGSKAIMVVRRGPDGKALTTGELVSVERADYVSLCRRHWEEEMGRWPLKVSRKKAAPKKPTVKKRAPPKRAKVLVMAASAKPAPKKARPAPKPEPKAKPAKRKPSSRTSATKR